jgi:hypothetical protein
MRFPLTVFKGKYRRGLVSCQGGRAFAPLAGKAKIRVFNARLTLKELMSPDIRLISSNGKVEGSIRGVAREYSVASRTSNGQNNLSNHLGHGPNHLDVKTSNANIQLEFLEQTPG